LPPAPGVTRLGNHATARLDKEEYAPVRGLWEAGDDVVAVAASPDGKGSHEPRGGALRQEKAGAGTILKICHPDKGFCGNIRIAIINRDPNKGVIRKYSDRDY
jgi:hypothetical protein